MIAAGNARAQDFNLAPPNAPDQQPACPSQTRAPVMNDSTQLISTVVAEGLENPWGMAELPDGGWLVTERPGRMRLVRPDGTVSEPIRGVPEVVTKGQGGLLDVAVRDDFAESRRVWWSFAQPRGAEGSATAVATGVLSAEGAALSQVRIVFQQQPAWQSNNHFGSRLVFDREGALFVTTGERSQPEPRQLAQDVGTHLWKIIRINPHGGAAPGNPHLAVACRRSGPMATETYRLRHLDRMVSFGRSSMAHVEATNLTVPSRAKTMAGPSFTYVEDYSGAQSAKGSQHERAWSSPSTTGIR